MFFAEQQQQQRQPLPTPGRTPTNGGTMSWTKAQIEEVRAMETSKDPKERKKARELLRDYRREHGSYPYKL